MGVYVSRTHVMVLCNVHHDMGLPFSDPQCVNGQGQPAANPRNRLVTWAVCGACGGPCL